MTEWPEWTSMMELHIGSSAYEIVMNKLREQGCDCEPSEIKVSGAPQGRGRPGPARMIPSCWTSCARAICAR